MSVSKNTNANGFARAFAQLSSQRPVRSARLREIAAEIKGGNSVAAEPQLTAFLAKSPDQPDALNLKAQIAASRKRNREAASLLARCLELAPDFALARYNYASVLYQLQECQIALEQVNLLLSTDAQNALYRHLKANIFETIGESEQSLALFEQLALENPQRAESWISYGQGLRALGRHQESIEAYRKAIECRPSYGQAYWSLAHMKTVRFSDADILAMQRQLAQADIAQDDRILLQFSLGKAHEDRREYAQSFDYYAKGNAAMRLRIDYDPELLKAGVQANIALFTKEFFAGHGGSGCQAPDPIFIVGRPRSGSTLIEQILSSHSAIEGTSELPYIVAIASRLANREGDATLGSRYLTPLLKMDPDAITALGEEYLAHAQTHRKLGKPFFIDKKPANFFHLGMMQLILPNAKIIDARRNPAASGFSIFATHSTKSRLRLSELGSFYRDYLEFMEHFDTVLPGKIHRVIYENLVSDTELEVRKLLDYLGLPFEENCLRFYETKRTVLTPSSEQVRKPISRDAVDHWRNYEPWLGPLTKSLGTALTGYPDVPAELRSASAH